MIGIRTDGVEDIEFSGLDLSDLHKVSALGSELCGEYGDELIGPTFGGRGQIPTKMMDEEAVTC